MLQLLASRCRCYLIITFILTVFNIDICVISNITLWHNVYSHKSIDCDNLYWLHPAKTSSSLIIPLQHICCKQLFENITSGITLEMLEDSHSKQVTPVTLQSYMITNKISCTNDITYRFPNNS